VFSGLFSDFKYVLKLAVVVISLCHVTSYNLRDYCWCPDCLNECKICDAEHFDGDACRESCILTKGASIDVGCKLGPNVGKHYAVLKAIDTCKKQCNACFKSKGYYVYYENGCIAACEKSSGTDQDKACKKHCHNYYCSNINFDYYGGF